MLFVTFFDTQASFNFAAGLCMTLTDGFAVLLITINHCQISPLNKKM